VKKIPAWEGISGFPTPDEGFFIGDGGGGGVGGGGGDGSRLLEP
jgi:hypothetical protein